MSDSDKSLEGRKRKLLDGMMAAGNGGFTSSAPAEGPVAGFDPVMSLAANMKKFEKELSKRKKEQKKAKQEEFDSLFTDEELKHLPKLTVSPLRIRAIPSATGSKVVVGSRPVVSMTASLVLSNPDKPPSLSVVTQTTAPICPRTSVSAVLLRSAAKTPTPTQG